MKFKPDNKARNIEEACSRLRAMVGRVPSLRALEVGPHADAVSPRSLDVALLTRFEDLAALHAYAEDPIHAEVKAFLAGVLEASYVVDFAGTPR